MNRTVLTFLLALVSVASQAQTKTSTLIRGRIINLPKEAENQLTIDYYNPLQAYFPTWVPLQLDSLGRFEVEVPLKDTSPVGIVYMHVLLSPGETYDVELDDERVNVTCSSGNASLTNEVLDHQPEICSISIDDDDIKDKSDAFVIEAFEKELKRVEAANDSIIKANPHLSQGWRDYARNNALASMADELVQRKYVKPSIRQNADGRLWQWLHDRFICQLQRPYSLFGDRLGYIVLGYTQELLNPHTRSEWNLRGIDTAIDIALEQQADGTVIRTEAFADSLHSLRVVLREYKALVESGIPDSVLTNHPFVESASRLYSDPYIKGLIKDGIVSERMTAEDIGRIALLNMPEEVSDYARAVLLYSEMEQYHAPLRPALKALIREVKDKDFRELILEQDSHYRSLASQIDHEESLMPNELLSGLTDGKEIFSKIIEPYKGRILYVDFWGTWCGPCKSYLQMFTQPLHEALKGLPVTYLYLCNGSPTEAWRSTIAEYKLTDEHSVHYNLPAAQQQAVEQYIGVKGFPTYIIIAPDGTVIKDYVPRPNCPEAVRETMLKLKDK